MSFTGMSISGSFSATQKKALDLAIPEDIVALVHTLTFTEGYEAGKVNLLWYDRRTLAAPGDLDTLDLAGTMKDAFNDAVVFARLKVLFIRNLSTVSGIQWGQPADGVPIFNATARMIVGANGFVLAGTDKGGWLVGAGATDKLTVYHDGAVGSPAVVYDIALLGASS